MGCGAHVKMVFCLVTFVVAVLVAEEDATGDPVDGEAAGALHFYAAPPLEQQGSYVIEV